MNEYSGQDVGTQRRSHQTEPKSNVLTGRSKFPMSYRFPTSMRYGEISPFYYQHGIGDDTIPLYSEHTLRTHTLSSPVESEVEMQKTYFSVPMEAIYPFNWERMQVSPSHGDDIPDDNRCVLPIVNTSIRVLNRLRNIVLDNESLNNIQFKVLLDCLFFIESIHSDGSLFANFNIHLSPLVYFTNEDGSSVSPSLDEWLDKFYPRFFREIGPRGSISAIFTIDGTNYSYTGEIVGPSYTNNGVRYVNLHQLLTLLRSESYSVDLDGDTLLTAFLKDGEDFEPVNEMNITPFSQPINLEVILAYQLGCFQYFSDSRIDDIFDAPRFRSLISSIYRRLFSDGYPSFFSYNGEMIQYDILSAKHLAQYLYLFDVNGGLSDENLYIRNFFDLSKLLFSFRNSLRFGDYFLTARLRQYGVGDTSIDTSSGSVSALDITRNIQWQRFLQSVSWSKQNLKDYVRDVLGIQKRQTPRKDVPMFIASDRFRIDGYEVENTGSEQRDVNSITTLVKTNQGRFAFEFEPENQCIIIGVMHFDVERIYSKGLDRMHTHQNRYDDVIPEMQFIGDQEIRKNEFDVSLGDGVFGWTLRYMPYKIRTSYAAGAFVNFLKSWMLITDNKDGNFTTGSIDSRYLRSTPAEFDRFYTSLNGCSLASYYHFMVVNRNYQELTRDLVYAPEPLK